MKEVHVAVGVVRQGEDVLIARRPEGAHQGGLLEFPGGKVESGERVQQALVRELHEEVGVEVSESSLSPLIGIRHDYGDKRVFLDVWQTDQFAGEPHGREGQPVSWRSVASLQDVDFPAANGPIIRALQLPSVYPITGGAGLDADTLFASICHALTVRPCRLFLLRAPWLDQTSYLSLATRLSAWCQNHDIRLMLHGSPALLDLVPAAGVHLPWHVAAGMQARPLASDRLLGVSCHDSSELVHATRLGADFATLGPVAETPSHPGKTPMGWPGFADLAAMATVPVYALGGLGVDEVDQAVAAGAQGIAGISTWWSISGGREL